MTTAYSRVTVVNGARRVDLALPSSLPLSDVMPQLLGYCAPVGQAEQPVGWALARLGGNPLQLSATLADAGITDGDVLELRGGDQAIRPAYVEDVRDVLEDTIDKAARKWQPRTTVGFALAAGGCGLALAALYPQLWQPRSAGALAAAASVAALLVLAGDWAARRDYRYLAQLLVAVAVIWGGVGGWQLASYPQWPVAAAVGTALAFGLLVAAVARALTPVATGHLAALGILAVAGVGTGAVSLAGVDPLVGIRVAAVAAVLAVGVLPRVSLTVGGLASADYRVRNQVMVAGEELAGRIEQSSALLYGSLAGTAIVGLVGGVLLAIGEAHWDRLLGAVVGLALVLRSRVFSRIPQILPPRVAGLAVLAASGWITLQSSAALGPWAITLAAVAAAGIVAVSAVPLSDVARARLKQLLNQAELVVVAGMVALAAASLGLFAWVAEISPG